MEMASKLTHIRFSKGKLIDSPSSTFSYLQNMVSQYDREVFGALFLDTKNRIIRCEALFMGSLNSASVHPRVVVKRALELNVSCVIAYHNHPSGDPTPSDADVRITHKLKEALALLDIRLLDHIVVGSEGCVSLAEQGHV